MKNSNYIKKYADFYLSKYSVTKKKFEDILKKKLSKDLFQKKIRKEEYDTYLETISNSIDYYDNLGLFNEEILIKNKIDNYILRGFSYRKINYLLIQNRFTKELIEKEIKKIKDDRELNKTIIIKFIEKKMNTSKYKKLNISKNECINKLISELVQNGFDYDDSRSILNQYFYDKKLYRYN